jgi:hypothetical protein
MGAVRDAMIYDTTAILRDEESGLWLGDYMAAQLARGPRLVPGGKA